MRKLMIRNAIAFCVLLLNVISLYAQQGPTLKNQIMISDFERKNAEQKLQVRAPLIVNNYDLKYHRLRLFIDPAQTNISGIVTSYFVPTGGQISEIQFELDANMSGDSAYHNGFKLPVNHEGNVISIPFGQFLPSGVLDSVTVYYHGNPQSSGFGSYGTEIHAGVSGIWTLSEPYGASDWWPSKDDLTDKIDSIDVYIYTPKQYRGVSNGVLQSEKELLGSYKVAHWKHRYPIASYLIAIAATNYARYDDHYIRGNDTLVITNHVYPEDSLALTNESKIVVPCLELFEDLFTDYPFWDEKYGHTQFGWGGGMEHQTNTFLGKGAFNPHIISHELAHQWFGDMITCGSWEDIWLNEGFATYCTGLMYEHMFDGYYWPIWKNQGITYTTSQNGGSVFCDDTTSVWRIFDSRLSYTKGAMLLHMLRWVVGDEKFYSGVNSYLNDPVLRYKFARTPDLVKHMEEAYGKELDWFFDDWFTGQGFPVYDFEIGQLPEKQSTIKISQTQSHPSVSFFELPLPFRFYGGGKDTLIVFSNTENDQTFDFLPGFMIDSIHFDPDMWIVCKVNAMTLGRYDLPSGESLEVMPNPVSHKLYIKHTLHEASKIELLALDGKSQNYQLIANNDNSTELDVSSVPSGLYLLRLHFGKVVVTRKVIIQK